MKVVAIVPIKLSDFNFLTDLNNLIGDNSYLTSTLNTLLKVKKINDIYIYCADNKAKDYVKGRVKFKKRPAELDEENVTSNKIVKSFVSHTRADIYVLFHATFPFTNPDNIDYALDNVISGKFDSAFPVKKITEYIWYKGSQSYFNLSNLPSKVWNDDYISNYDLSAINKTEIKQNLYVETTGFYVFNSSAVKIDARRIGKHPLLIPITKFESINVNNLEDVELIQKIKSIMH